MTSITKEAPRKLFCDLQIITLVMLSVLAILLHAGPVNAQWATSGNNINNTNTGNVGIGPTAPLQKLQIGSNTPVSTATPDSISLGATYSSTAGANPKLRLFDSNSSSVYGLGVSSSQFDFMVPTAARYSWNINGVEKMRLDAAGNLGIGTSSPQNILHLVNTGTSVPFRMESTNASGFSGFNFYNEGGSLASSFVHANSTASALPNSTWLGSRNAEPLIFVTNGTGERMRIDSTGNVGIGINAPTAKLHVAGNGYITGNLTVDGNLAAKYQDLAEWVESSQLLTAATVVVLDQSKTNQVIASSRAYDTRVAGVISAKPGITLGERGESKVLVASTGRVKVKVDAALGSIQVGDLLVTSDRSGMAMKSQPVNIGGIELHRPGTLIGKALEPLARGTGEILVLLSLQ